MNSFLSLQALASLCRGLLGRLAGLQAFVGLGLSKACKATQLMIREIEHKLSAPLLIVAP